MNFLTRISSLKEKALYHVALNLSQDNTFKEVSMCLETPTHGFTILHRGQRSILFISRSLTLSVQNKAREAKMKDDDELANTLWDSLHSNPENKSVLWDVAVEEQCQRLTAGLPSSFKNNLHVWINRFALEYLSYSRRQESLFGLSRYFFMDILTRDDWTEDGRLNEVKIAKRLLRDKRLTNVQKYRITCVYCLHRSIPLRWGKLTEEEKQSVSEKDDPYYEENSSLVSVWYNYMEMNEMPWQRQFLWRPAAGLAVRYGNKTALMFFWNKIRQRDRRWEVIELALKALNEWKFAEILGIRREKLTSNEYCSPCDAPNLNLPHYYSDLLKFFLSQMDERQIVQFFEQAFEKESKESQDILASISVLECFLAWPLQEYFLPVMNLLWGTIPKSKYGQCLYFLSCKNSGKLKRYYSSISLYAKVHLYDYESMLWDLWEATPDEYKQQVFNDNEQGSEDHSSKWIKRVLFQLLEKYPFEKRTVAIFKRIWLHLPQEMKSAMTEVEKPKMSFFSFEEDICWKLLEKEKWSLANWLLEENFSDEKILNYKKRLIESRGSYCFFKVQENCFQFVEGLMDWCLLTDTEKAKFKYDFFTEHDTGLESCSHFLTKGEFTKVENIIDFYLSSDETKEQFKIECGEDACRFLVDDCEWKLMDKILTWCNQLEKGMPDYKQLLFSCEGFSVHFRLVFVRTDWENVECFYKWFCLSPEEIIKIKKESAFMPQVFDRVHEALYEDDIDEMGECLRWCLTDEEMVNNFKEEVEKKYFNVLLRTENDKKAKKLLDYLISEILCGLKKEVEHDVANREVSPTKDKGDKRLLVIEDGSTSVKRLRHET